MTRYARLYQFSFNLALVWGLSRGETGKDLALRIAVVPVLAMALRCLLDIAWRPK